MRIWYTMRREVEKGSTDNNKDKERDKAMKNIDKYEHSVKAALEAYNTEMAALTELNLDGCSFEDWTEREEDSTAKEVAAEEKIRKEMKLAEDAEKDAVRKGMEELKKFYKDAGWDKAYALLDKINEVDPKYEVYENMASACNVFHSGAWSVMCDDFEGVWDMYQYLKRECYCNRPCRTPSEFIAYMKSDIPEAIATFTEEAEELIPRLAAK